MICLWILCSCSLKCIYVFKELGGWSCFCWLHMLLEQEYFEGVNRSHKHSYMPVTVRLARSLRHSGQLIQ